MNTEFLEKFDLDAPARNYRASVVPLASPTPAAARSLPKELKEEDVFTWAAVISNQRLDSWWTRMANSSLQNYAEDARAGVAFMNSHKHNELPTGYSFDGTFEETGSPAQDFPRVVADFYTVRGLEINGLNTDMFIKAVQSQIIRDVSIGFKEGEGFQYTCAICGEDFWSWDCMHIPGVEYDVIANPDADPSQQNTVSMVAFAWVENARLSETSAVYDGATPNAMIIKATRELRAGRMQSGVESFLQSKFRIELPKDGKVYTVPDSKTKTKEGETTMNNGTDPSGAPDKFAVLETSVRSMAQGFKLPEITDASTGEQALSAMRVELERLRALEPKAQEGVKLRKALEEDAIREGVRAFGDEFEVTEKTAMLTNLDVDTVTSLRDTWKGIADSEFSNKKRQSRESDDESDEGGERGEDDDAELEVTNDVPEEVTGGV